MTAVAIRVTLVDIGRPEWQLATAFGSGDGQIYTYVYMYMYMYMYVYISTIVTGRWHLHASQLFVSL